jgi:hypothetical protein
VAVAVIGTGYAIFCSQAKAIPLLPGGSVALTGTTLALTPQLKGYAMIDQAQKFTFKVGTKTYSGELQDQVVREDSTGHMDFYYRIIFQQEIQTGRLWVERTAYPGSDQGGYTTDVNYRTDGDGIMGPTQAYRSSDGVSVTFNYNGFMATPGSSGSSRWSFVATNATWYDNKGTIRFQVTGGTMVTLSCYEPAK